MFWQKSFSMLAVLMMSKPTSPPKVDGFQYCGLEMGLDIIPLTANGPPMLTIVNGVTEPSSFSNKSPVHQNENVELFDGQIKFI